MSYPKRVRLVEVSPRDGLQNEPQTVPVAVKKELIERLLQSGLTEIEVTGFVHPAWVPQLADAQALCDQLEGPAGVVFSALVPNETGMRKALQCDGLQRVAVFTAASEEFTQKNINCSIDESLQRFQPVMKLASEAGLPVRGYVSCVLGCPYAGPVAIDRVVSVTERLLAMGCDEVSLGDTIGVGTAESARRLYRACLAVAGPEQLALHFHDTYGQALANIHACLEEGACIIDASVAGLGGCPYAKGASGNVATEDVVYLLNGLGIAHGVDLPVLARTGHWISQQLGRDNNSKAGRAVVAKALSD